MSINRNIKNFIKRLVPRSVLLNVSWYSRYMFSYFKKSPFKNEIANKKKIVILGVADYKNLGDHAIGYAQKKFLDKIIDGNKNIEVLEVGTKVPIRFIYEVLNKEDIILFTGGGNLGNKYDYLYNIYLPIIEKYANNFKLFFPQSYTFINDLDLNDKELGRVKRVFSQSKKKLTIVARESKSFDKFTHLFTNNKILFTPDIVLSLNERTNDIHDRDGILFMMRDESEKVLSNSIQQQLSEQLIKDGYKLTYQKDYSQYKPDISSRYGELQIQWDIIRNSKIVVTDRLHGMIFSQITGTPCLAFDNYNNKVKMTYQDWLSDHDNLIFIDPFGEVNVDEVLESIRTLLDAKDQYIDMSDKFEPITHEIRKMISITFNS